jgi:PIN domain nuclease of toxin-antitoxin system
VRVLLDTCTFLWIAAGAREMSGRARDFFSDPANEVYLSSVSAWEIVVKHSLGRLALPDPPHVFVPRQRESHEIAPLPLDEDAVLTLGRLPEYHKDPFDRMLVCQAIVHGLTILTPDKQISQYPVQTAW